MFKVKWDSPYDLDEDSWVPHRNVDNAALDDFLRSDTWFSGSCDHRQFKRRHLDRIPRHRDGLQT